MPEKLILEKIRSVRRRLSVQRTLQTLARVSMLRHSSMCVVICC